MWDGVCRNLMAKQDMSELGFGKQYVAETSSEENKDERIEKWRTLLVLEPKDFHKHFPFGNLFVLHYFVVYLHGLAIKTLLDFREYVNYLDITQPKGIRSKQSSVSLINMKIANMPIF